MKKVAWALLLSAGCQYGKKATADPAEIRAGVVGYVEASEKADATKTHASGDYLIANQAKDKHGNDLAEISRKGGKEPVLVEIRSAREVAQKEREAVQQKVNHLQVVGRGHSPDEKEWLTNGAPQEIKKIEFRIASLDELESKLK
jgi:hypothetical protein